MAARSSLSLLSFCVLFSFTVATVFEILPPFYSILEDSPAVSLCVHLVRDSPPTSINVTLATEEGTAEKGNFLHHSV